MNSMEWDNCTAFQFHPREYDCVELDSVDSGLDGLSLFIS